MGLTIEELNDVVNYSKGEINQLYIEKKYGSAFFRLIDEYLGDKNSSTYRQKVTCAILGFGSNPKKLGYDTTKNGVVVEGEVKPKNIESNSDKKLDISGSYSDLTWKRHKEFKKQNPKIYLSGFIDGRIIFILEIPYSEICKIFEKQLMDKLPNGDIPSKYVRSAKFSFNQIKDSENLHINFLREDFQNFYPFFNKKLYTYLKENNGTQK